MLSAPEHLVHYMWKALPNIISIIHPAAFHKSSLINYYFSPLTYHTHASATQCQTLPFQCMQSPQPVDSNMTEQYNYNAAGRATDGMGGAGKHQHQTQDEIYGLNTTH